MLRWSLWVRRAALLSLAACGAEVPPPKAAEVPVAASSAPANSAPSAESAPVAPAPMVEGCWKIVPAPPFERDVARVFARYAATAFGKLDHPGTEGEARLAAQLRSVGMAGMGAPCPEVRVAVGEVHEDQPYVTATLTVEVPLAHEAVSLTVTATIPRIAPGHAAQAEIWTFGEPVERALARVLLARGLATALEAAPDVAHEAGLKLDSRFLWAWARSDDHASQCLLALDGSKRWCWRSPPRKHGPYALVAGWRNVGGELHGFLEPSDGVTWAVALPEGRYAVTHGTSAWPTAGFAALPNDDPAPGTAGLPIAHERDRDGGRFDTEVGPLMCRRAAGHFVCRP